MSTVNVVPFAKKSDSVCDAFRVEAPATVKIFGGFGPAVMSLRTLAFIVRFSRRKCKCGGLEH